MIARLQRVAFLGVQRVQRNAFHAAAALGRLGVMPFVGQKVLHRRQEKSAETPALRVCVGQPFFFQQAREKFLRQIPRLLRTVPAGADEA